MSKTQKNGNKKARTSKKRTNKVKGGAWPWGWFSSSNLQKQIDDLQAEIDEKTRKLNDLKSQLAAQPPATTVITQTAP